MTATNGVLKKPSKPTLDNSEEEEESTENCMLL